MEYNIVAPKTMNTIPKYWVITKFSFNMKDDNIALNNGVNESKGIVKLSSDFLIDSKKSKAEIVLIIIKLNPGTKYEDISILNPSRATQTKKIKIWVIEKIIRSEIEEIFFKVNFLLTSKKDQKMPETMQIKIAIRHYNVIKTRKKFFF